MKTYKTIIFVALCCFSTVYGYSQTRKKIFSEIKNSEYLYGNFNVISKQSDSINLSIKLIKDSIVNNIACFNFELKYKKERISLWIGYDDDNFYTFKKDKLKKPVVIFSRRSYEDKQGLIFYPFSDSYTLSMKEYPFDLDHPTDYEEEKLFVFSVDFRKKLPHLFKGITLYYIYIDSQKGLGVCVYSEEKKAEFDPWWD